MPNIELCLLDHNLVGNVCTFVKHVPDSRGLRVPYMSSFNPDPAQGQPGGPLSASLNLCPLFFEMGCHEGLPA